MARAECLATSGEQHQSRVNGHETTGHHNTIRTEGDNTFRTTLYTSVPAPSDQGFPP